MSFDPNTLGLLVVAVFNMITAVLAWRTHRAVMVVEKATNSMKDQLVAATASASKAEGVVLGRAEMRRQD